MDSKKSKNLEYVLLKAKFQSCILILFLKSYDQNAYICWFKLVTLLLTMKEIQSKDTKKSHFFSFKTALPIFAQIEFHHFYDNFTDTGTAAVAQWVVALALQAECYAFQSQPQVVKRDSDSSTAKRLAIDVSVTGPRR